MPRYSRRRKIRWSRVLSCAFAAILLTAAVGILIQVSAEFPLSAADRESSQAGDGSVSQVDMEPRADVSAAASATVEKDSLPEGWEWTTVPAKTLYTGDLILVNPDYAYQAGSETPVSVLEYKTDSYYVKDRNVALLENVVGHLNDMMDDFTAQSGLTDVLLISGWRDPDRQETLYQEDLEEKNQTQSTLVAVPGHSEHHTGLAFDFGLMQQVEGVGRTYDGTGSYAWINENCQEYGFVVRYPEDKMDITKIEYEPWHFRYVGQPHAKIMNDSAIVGSPICLEEYIEFLKKYPLDGEHLSAYGYEICWQEPEKQADGQLKIAVPSGRDYTLSGDNTGGIIVTAEDTGDGANDDFSRG